MKKEDILKVAQDSYFITADMIKFLLVENLALKTMLHDKGIIDADEFKECKEKAARILEEKTGAQITEQFQRLLSGDQSNGSDDV